VFDKEGRRLAIVITSDEDPQQQYNLNDIMITYNTIQSTPTLITLTFVILPKINLENYNMILCSTPL